MSSCCFTSKSPANASRSFTTKLLTRRFFLQFDYYSISIYNIALSNICSVKIWLCECHKLIFNIGALQTLFRAIPLFSIGLSVRFHYSVQLFLGYSEVYLVSCQISSMKLFSKIVKGQKLLTIFTKNSNLDVWQGPT